FLTPNSSTAYSNTLHLAAGSTIDFVVGKGADGLTADTGLKIQATATRADIPPPPPPTTNCVPVNSGLIAWWRGEGNANDSVGSNHGQLFGATSFAPGKVGRGFVFNGVTDFVLVPDSPSLDLTNEITMEMWFKS